MSRSLLTSADRPRYGLATPRGSAQDFLPRDTQENRVEGGTDDDSVYGQSGNDWPRRSDGADAIAGDSGTDACTCSAGNDELQGDNP